MHQNAARRTGCLRQTQTRSIEGSEYILDMDTVVIAIGTGPSPLLPKATSGLQLNKYGYIDTDENGKTSKEGVWAEGI